MLTQRFPHLHLIAAALLTTGLALGQTSTAGQAPTVSTASPEVLAAFDVSRGNLQALSLPQKATPGFHVNVVFGSRTYTLRLHAHDVRAKDFQLLVHDNTGLRAVKTPANTTYRGVVDGIPNSLVSASFFAGQLQARVHFDQSSTWAVQPVSRIIKTSPRNSHIVFDESDSNVPNAKCGVTDLDTVKTPNVAYSSGSNSICEIACDADIEFYQRNGSNITSTQNDVTAIINAVSAIYERDVQIEYEITTIIVRTTSVYSTNGASSLLSQFRSRWRSVHGNIRRDVAHLFTGRNLSGSTIGIAYLRVICTNSGYGLSQSRFTSNFSFRAGLTAHELGHNWGAGHCSGGGCYIMCPGLGGCGRNVSTFASGSRNAITSHAASRTCLSVNVVTLTSVQPNRVQAFRGGTINLRGTNFDSATRVYVGNIALSKGTGPSNFTIVNDNVITFPSPRPANLNPVMITVENSGGRSNGKPLVYDPTDPPKLEVPTTVPRNSFLVWQFGGGPAHRYFVTLAATPTTAKVLGFDWLLNSVVIASGTLDASGFGLYFVQVPASVGLGLQVSSQVVTIDLTKSEIAGTSNVVSTTVR